MPCGMRSDEMACHRRQVRLLESEFHYRTRPVEMWCFLETCSRDRVFRKSHRSRYSPVSIYWASAASILLEISRMLWVWEPLGIAAAAPPLPLSLSRIHVAARIVLLQLPPSTLLQAPPSDTKHLVSRVPGSARVLYPMSEIAQPIITHHLMREFPTRLASSRPVVLGALVPSSWREHTRAGGKWPVGAVESPPNGRLHQCVQATVKRPQNTWGLWDDVV